MLLFNVLFKEIVLCAGTVYRYIEDRCIGVLSHTFYCNFCRDIAYLSLYRGYRYIEDRCIGVPLYLISHDEFRGLIQLECRDLDLRIGDLGSAHRGSW